MTPTEKIIQAALTLGLPKENQSSLELAIDLALSKLSPKASPKSAKAAGRKSAKVGWRKYGPMRLGSCGQCGDNGGNPQHGAGGHGALCDRCWEVYRKSAQHWLPNQDFATAG